MSKKMVREFDQSSVVEAYLGAMDALRNAHRNERQAAGAQRNQR